MVFLENLTDVVLWLLLTILWVNLLFLCFLAYRRLTRLRYYEVKDGARTRYASVVEQFRNGDISVETAAALLRNATLAAEIDAVHELLFADLAPADADPTTHLLFTIGSIDRWARTAFGRKRASVIVARAMRGEQEAIPTRERTASFFNLRRLRLSSVERAKAVVKLGRLAPNVALAFASEALRDPSPEVRRLAVAAMGRNGHPGAIPLLIQELEAAVAHGRNDVSLRGAKSALVGYRMEQLSHFVPYLRHPQARVRFFVIDAIRDICNRAAERSLIAKNDFPIQLHQICLENLVTDANPDVRARVGGVIRFFRDAASLDALRRLLQDENEFVRLHAVRACGDRYLLALIADVAECLSDSRWRIREAAVKSLRVFGSAGRDLMLRQLVTSSDRYACEQLAEELQRSGMITELLAESALDAERARFAAAVFRKLTMLEKDALLLQALAAPSGEAVVRLRLLEVLMDDPRPEVLAAVEMVAQGEDSIVGERAALLLRDLAKTPSGAWRRASHA